MGPPTGASTKRQQQKRLFVLPAAHKSRSQNWGLASPSSIFVDTRTLQGQKALKLSQTTRSLRTTRWERYHGRNKESLFLMLEIPKEGKKNWFQFIMFLNTLLKNEKECVIKTVNFISHSMEEEHIYLWNIWLFSPWKFKDLYVKNF